MWIRKHRLLEEDMVVIAIICLSKFKTLRYEL